MLFGTLGSVLLLGLYFLIVSLANSFQHALEEFQRMWYWMILLVIGFGIQIGLFTYVREKAKNVKGIAATGGVSTASMISCCVHHITEIIPILGVSAVSFFFAKYQLAFLIIGILSNILGIHWMFILIQRHKLYEKRGTISKLMKLNLEKIWKYNLSGSLLITLGALVLS